MEVFFLGAFFWKSYEVDSGGADTGLGERSNLGALQSTPAA